MKFGSSRFYLWLGLILWFGIQPTEPTYACLQSGRGEELPPKCIASGTLAGHASDLSPFVGQVLEDGSPTNRLGGFSAIEFDSTDQSWLVLSDRGPGDGATSFPCRVHRFRMEVDASRQQIVPTLVSTTLLKSAGGAQYVGSLKALRFGSEPSNAVDPEGLRQLESGDWVVSDEYGPKIEVFDRQGMSRSILSLPEYARLPSPEQESQRRGAVANRGLEGLAMDHEHGWIVSIMQGSLRQDAIQEGSKWLGRFVRIFAFDGKSGKPVHQWVYLLEDTSCGISEILYSGPNRFLVIERDSLVGVEAKQKRIYEIDVSQATDIGDRELLGTNYQDSTVQAVKKKLLIDLLDPAYPFHGSQALTKPEGLAWGPNLADGSRLLMVCVDNDFVAETPSTFMAFSIPASAGR